MTSINWVKEVQRSKNQLIKDTRSFLQIKSVYDPPSISENAPMGQGIAKALEHLLHQAEAEGFRTKNLDGYAGHIEWGAGDELIGVLCHVDVVPEGEGWTSHPYSAEIRDGKIYARGALDDKGPTIAAYYALKIIKELNLPLHKRVRIILGTDEERNWQCVQHYFKHEEMPTMGFAPDADFPIIYAEKGIANFFLTREEAKSNENKRAVQVDTDQNRPLYTLLQLESGLAVNMVPEQARATIQVAENKSGEEDLLSRFNQYIGSNKIVGRVLKEGQQMHLTMEGASAHGAQPHKGINAGFLLITFLKQLSLQPAAQSLIQMMQQYFVDDSKGTRLGIEIQDELTGPLSINVGVLQFGAGKPTRIGLNLRYPVSTPYDEMMNSFAKQVEEYGFKVTDMDNSSPHYVAKEHPLIQTLQKVYEEQTGEQAKLLSIGGGTYARSLEAGVAFGPLFPGKEETAHQKDEYIEIEDLLKATAIYAQAIYELASLSKENNKNRDM